MAVCLIAELLAGWFEFQRGWYTGLCVRRGYYSQPDLNAIVPTITSFRGNRAEAWIRGVPFSVITNGYLTPNHRLPDVNVHGRGWFAPRSLHTGGAQMALCDGSVRMNSNSIDQPTQWAMFSRAMAERYSIRMPTKRLFSCWLAWLLLCGLGGSLGLGVRHSTADRLSYMSSCDR